MKRMKALLASIAGFSLLTAAAFAQGNELAIENDSLIVKWNTDSGHVSLIHKPSGKTFVQSAELTDAGGTARLGSVSYGTFGEGQAIEVSYPNGNRDAVMLFPGLPFALFRSSLHNGDSEPTVAHNGKTLSATVGLEQPVAQLKTFGTGGLLAPDKNPGSYVWLSVVEPRSRNGIVFAWLTHERGSGVLFSDVEDDAIRVDARVDFGRLRIMPGETESLETLAVGYFEDARLGLETWADTEAKVLDIHLPPQPTGYCTWYSRPHGGASDEEHIAELSSFAAKNLAPYGFSVVQIDDHWQAGVSTNGPNRNFTVHAKDGPYPGGMKAAADNIKSLGLVPGLWFMPFAGTYYDPYFADHQDWFVKRGNGEPYETSWGGTCLDMTFSGAREHLRDVVQRITGEWGYRYLKIDGLWTGTATKQQYVNAGYKEDNMGDAVFHDPDKTNIEAYRSGLRLLREAAGPDVFILGCNGPQNMRSYGGAFGLVDGMRIGPDNGSPWDRLLRGPIFGSRHYFLNGRIWYNDPDPVYVRESMPLNHARLICSWVAITGQLNLSSEWLPGLPPERLDILKRTMPSHGLRPRPADLFENDPPTLWLLTDTRHAPRRDVIGVFNWSGEDKQFDYPFDHLGLEANTKYQLFDYWNNKLIPAMTDRLQITVPAESCRILAIKPFYLDYPRIISTSRHVTQGIVDVLEEHWSDANGTLSGKSDVIGGDPYELRITSDYWNGFWKPVSIHFLEPDNSLNFNGTLIEDGYLTRATINSPVSREVSWSIRFRKMRY